MPTFQFEGMDTSGGTVSDSLQAADESEAVARIRSMGYFVTKLKRVANAGPGGACPYCGQPIDSGAQRCEKCGAWITETAPSEPPNKPPLPEPPVASSDLDTRVLALLRSQNKIAAVKLVREQLSIGLKESVDYVDALAVKHGIAQKTVSIRCGTAVLLLMAIAMGIVASVIARMLIGGKGN